MAELAEPKTLAALVESMPSVAISCAVTALMYAELDTELDRFFDVVMEAAKKRGELVTLSNLLCFRGLTLAQRGDLEGAVQDLRESDELVSYLPSQQGAIYFRSYLADVLTNRGELEEAEQALAELGLPEEVADSGHLIFFLGARGWLRYARRDFAGAAADWERLGRCMEAFDMWNPAVVAWRSHLALAYVALQRRDEALELARTEVEVARSWGAPRPVGVALRALGMAQGGDEGIETLRESLNVLRDSSALLERARTLVELGAALRRANNRARLRCPLRVAAARRAGGGGARRHGGAPAKAPALGCRVAHGEREARREVRGGGALEQGHRAGALRHHEDRRGAPQQRLPQARDRVAHRVAARARRRGVMRLRRKPTDEAVGLVMVATDRSETAERAVRFAAEMASRYEAELLVLRVLVGGGVSRADAVRDLEEYVAGLDGERKRTAVVSGEDPADAIVDAARRERADVLVVGSVGMSGRREFLLRNVPNRVSHNAPCTVVIVQTHREDA
jgi:nucleotide-binding universal stress UspA family protein